MTSQAKHLKALLKRFNLSNASGRLSVKTERTRSGEWGNAVAHVRALTPDELAALKVADRYVEVSNFPDVGFAIIRW